MSTFDPNARRRFLRQACTLGASSTLAGHTLTSLAAPATVTLPFANGERDLIAYPQKRPLIRQTSRPPQLETPFSVFDENLLTPNDAFFVRYHLGNIPTTIDLNTYRIKVSGLVDKPLELSLSDLKQYFGKPVELVAVTQCSGNSRGFSRRGSAAGSRATAPWATPAGWASRSSACSKKPASAPKRARSRSRAWTARCCPARRNS